MKRFAKLLFVLSLLVIMAGLPVLAAHAAPAAGVHIQETTPLQPVDFDDLVKTVKNLGGFAALFAILVNIGKKAGWVKDGTAGTWSAGLNILLLVGLLVAQVLGYSNMVPTLDAQAGELANVSAVVLAYIFQLLVSRETHASVLAGLPVIGHSHSERVAGESGTILETLPE